MLLVGIVPVTLLIGVIAARVLKARRPAVYAGIGGAHAEDGHLPPAEPVDARVHNANAEGAHA